MENDRTAGQPTLAGLASAMELVPAALVMTDESGRIVLVNREAETLFSYARDELIGKGVELLIPSRFAREHPALRERYSASPQARRMGEGRDLHAKKKDGSEFPVEIGLNPIAIGDSRFVMSAVVDITDRKRSEARFRATVESAPLAMIMSDRNGTVVLANAEASALFGYGPGELLGRSIEILVPARFRAKHPSHRAGYMIEPQARRMGAGRDLTAVRKDGSEFPVEIGLNPIVTDEGTYVLSAIVDNTARKALESKLRELNEDLESRVRQRTAELAAVNQALEQSNMELRRFAYIASHDLRAPLRSISGFTQLLEAEHQGKLGEQSDDWIRRIVESAKRMHTLIEDLLEYSRLESRPRPFATVPMSEALGDALAVLEPSIRESNATITHDELPVVTGDRSQLVQLLQNLLENGMKYRRNDPPAIHVGCTQTPHSWHFSVADNGIGIEPKHHERIFEIFRRLHTDREYSGNGIGLAICRRVVHSHGGRIWIESEPGNGSTFHFTLPTNPEDPS